MRFAIFHTDMGVKGWRWVLRFRTSVPEVLCCDDTGNGFRNSLVEFSSIVEWARRQRLGGWIIT